MAAAATESAGKSPIENDNNEGVSNMIDLESKVMQVGNQKYYIDMKESPKSRFFKIVEVLPRYKRSRLVVPMTAAAQFCEKLQEVDKFATNYDASKHQKVDGRNGEFIHSLSLNTAGRRKYYFDLSNTGQFLDLKISYVYGDRRDDVHMVTDAIVEILNILNGFIQRYPPLPGQEEEDAAVRPPPRWNYEGGRRFFDGPPRGPRQANARQPRDARGPRRRNQPPNQPLVVLDDPAPSVIDLNQKGYLFEVVRGSHMFLRITESINGSKRSTIHVPAEVCVQFRDLIDRFAKSMKMTENVVSEPVPPQSVNN